LIKEIRSYARKHDLVPPDLSTVPGGGLKAVLADLKAAARRNKLVGQVLTLAAKKNYALPTDVGLESADQLAQLLKLIKRARRVA
jgi:hypothetical protein